MRTLEAMRQLIHPFLAPEERPAGPRPGQVPFQSHVELLTVKERRQFDTLQPDSPLSPIMSPPSRDSGVGLCRCGTTQTQRSELGHSGEK